MPDSNQKSSFDIESFPKISYYKFLITHDYKIIIPEAGNSKKLFFLELTNYRKNKSILFIWHMGINQKASNALRKLDFDLYCLFLQHYIIAGTPVPRGVRYQCLFAD